MHRRLSSRGTTLATIGSVAAWLALGLQFYLMLSNRTESIMETIIRFFSFFTILTNILVACCFTLLAIGKKQSFLTKPSSLSAVTVYILVVGIVYNLLLRSTWNPQGLQKVVDELLHSLIPLYFFIYWLFLIDKRGLKWSIIFSWLLYPLGYFAYILWRGSLSGFYPYAFINVAALSYERVITNAVLLLGAFLLLSSMLMRLGKFVDRKR